MLESGCMFLHQALQVNVVITSTKYIEIKSMNQIGLYYIKILLSVSNEKAIDHFCIDSMYVSQGLHQTNQVKSTLNFTLFVEWRPWAL